MRHMEFSHPIDAEIRALLKKHVPNQSEMSTAVGHSASWLHKYVNGDGHATIDDLIRIAGLLMGLNLPKLSENETRLLRACRKLEEDDCLDVLQYAEHRARLARNAQSKESSAPKAHTPPATKHTKRGTR